MRQTWPDIPGVAIWPWPGHGGVQVRIVDRPGPPTDVPAVEAEWRRLCAINPRFFDGPILSVEGLDPGREVRARIDRYRHLAVQPAVETGVDQLSVTGVVLSRAAAGDDRVFLG